MKESLYVINWRGEKEPFSFRKVYLSAKRAGADKELAEKIAKIIEKKAFSGIRTSEIFERVKQLLRGVPKVALKFNLKEGIRKLGPTGFPFEKFVGEIFKRKGYEVKLNLYLRGYCLKYETDFLAKKGNLIYVGECKFRNLPEEGLVHSQTSLAFWAKILDLKRGNLFRGIRINPILITNAKFTKEAIQYSRCVGIELLGWKCPKSKGLEKIIDENGFYPITILPSLNKDLADAFIKRKMILTKDLLEIDPQKFAREEKISEESLKELIKEAKILFE